MDIGKYITTIGIMLSAGRTVIKWLLKVINKFLGGVLEKFVVHQL